MIRIKTSVPGSRSAKILNQLKNKNGGWAVPHPLVMSGKGKGPYCEDIDGNRFLDFASQIATNPFGYNNEDMLKVIKKYSSRFPIKYAGQDFTVTEHLDMIDQLTSISPKNLNAAFLINSGAEAVENAGKICMRKRPTSKFSISMEGAFHGRTLGALSLTHSKEVHKRGYASLPNMQLPFNDSAAEELEKSIEENGKDQIGFLILEHFQGEGGYRIPSDKMINGLRRITKKHNIPYIADEVQSGLGRTGKWWAFEHYNITPDVFTSAKALQVGAVISSKNKFPNEPGAISSTWGGGHIIDLALGIKTIELIKRDRLLDRNRKMGEYILKRISTIEGIENPRGRGLMIGFDLANSIKRDNFIIECAKSGLLILGCGKQSARIIPPYIIDKSEVDEGIKVIEKSLKKVRPQGFKHTGKICDFMSCAQERT
jgi:4-aminobutyrate aminotransferase